MIDSLGLFSFLAVTFVLGPQRGWLRRVLTLPVSSGFPAEPVAVAQNHGGR